MAKINTGTIEGYESMTPEERLKAVLDMEVPDDMSTEYSKLKASFDKTSSELADAKKKLRETQTAEELAKSEQEAAQNELRERYEALLKESTINKYTAKYTAIGMDVKLAGDVANAMYNGDTDKVFSGLEKFKADLERNIRSDIAKNAPKPNTGGDADNKITKEQFNKMNYSERVKLFEENESLYKELNGG